MRVKLGDTWYDAEDIPVCIQFTEDELKSIKGMTKKTSPQLKYAVFEEGSFDSVEEIKEWMSD